MSAATAPVPPLPTLCEAIERPLETLAALPGRGNAAWIQSQIASSLLSARVDRPPPEDPQGALPTFPAWHLCTPEQQRDLRRHKRRQGRSYHRSKPLHGLKAEDRLHEARTARAIALDDDVRRARGRDDWWRSVEGSKYVASLDETQRHPTSGLTKRETVERLVRVLGACYRPGSMTSSPGHDYLARRLGVTLRTIARYMRELEGAGFIVALSAGRSVGQPGTNGAALRVVYLLTVPLDAQDRRAAQTCTFPNLTARLRAAVEKPVTPSGLPERGKSHVRARERRPDGTRPLVGPEDTPSGLFGQPIPPGHPGFSRTFRMGSRRLSRENRLTLAHALMSSFPGLGELRGLSERAVAAAIRDFVDAGYSFDDIAHMLTWLPTGQLRPHSGLYGIERPVNWIARVFDPWRDAAGLPAMSFGARNRKRRDDRQPAEVPSKTVAE